MPVKETFAEEKEEEEEEALWSQALAALTERRVRSPERAFELAEKRERRTNLTADGRLNIIAADHPARGVLKAGDNKMAMASRSHYLFAIVEILSADLADGVMATMDILEELLWLDEILGSFGRQPFLRQKLMIASLNRGGLSGSAWELDDPVTGATPESTYRWNLDGAKLLLRIDEDDRDSLATIRYCAQATSALARLKLPTFLEPLPVTSVDSESNNSKVESGRSRLIKKDSQSLQKIVGIASALGETSSYLWLKLPFCPDFQAVAQATTLPILMLGGETAQTGLFLAQMQEALAASTNVRGTMIGRNILFSQGSDRLSTARKLHDLVHGKP